MLLQNNLKNRIDIKLLQKENTAHGMLTISVQLNMQTCLCQSEQPSVERTLFQERHSSSTRGLVSSSPHQPRVGAISNVLENVTHSHVLHNTYRCGVGGEGTHTFHWFGFMHVMFSCRIYFKTSFIYIQSRVLILINASI